MNDYLEYVLEQLEGLGPLRWRKMFGGVGLYAEDLFFGLIASDVLYLKVNGSNRADYESRESQPFQPHGEGGGSLGYWELPVAILEKPKQAVAWARLSVEIAREAPKSRRKSSKRSAVKSQTPPDQKLAKLRNLGPASVGWLAKVGLSTRADLERVGSLGAYRLVRGERGKASLNLLYALEAALLGVHWNDLPPPLKAKLKAAAKERKT